MFKKKLINLIGPDAPPKSIYRELVCRMLDSGVRFRRGMRQTSIDVVQERSGIVFPADLREFWTVAVPTRGKWIDWENSPPTVQGVEDWLAGELLFDVRNNEFWPDDLDAPPEDPAQQEIELRRWIRKGPQLIPLFAHRAMVGEPLDAGNPVLSIWQSDWIYYGWDLPSYLEQEFLNKKLDYSHPPTIKPIGQWSRIVG